MDKFFYESEERIERTLSFIAQYIRMKTDIRKYITNAEFITLGKTWVLTSYCKEWMEKYKEKYIPLKEVLALYSSKKPEERLYYLDKQKLQKILVNSLSLVADLIDQEGPREWFIEMCWVQPILSSDLIYLKEICDDDHASNHA